MKSLSSRGARCAPATLLVGALVAPALSFAQTPPPAVSATLPTVVVTTTRTPVEVAEALAAVTVIDREQIERSQVTDVAEILRFEAGLDLGRTGGPGQQMSVFIRGGESNHTLVLIDGIRMNPTSSGGGALQNITTDMIERIEIVRGPRSTLYGSDAIGGVVNIITRTATEPQASVVLRGGVDNQRDAAVNLGYGDGEKSLSLGVEQIRTDGFPSLESTTLDRGYRNTSVNLRGSTQLGEKASLGVRLWNADGNVEYQGFSGPRDQDFQNQVAAIELNLDPHAQWHTTMTVSRAEDDIRQNQSDGFIRTVRPVFDWHNVVRAGQAHRVSFGASATREDVTSLAFSEERDVYSGFVQDEITLGRHRVIAGANFADYDGFGEQFNWNAEYGFDLFASTRLIAAAGTGFRAPDADDRFGFGGDPDLEPEESLNYELGLKHELSARQSVDLRLFQSEVDDLISLEFNPTAPGNDFGFIAVNIDEYRNRGVELTWEYASKVWTASLSGIAQKPEDRATDDTLLRRAEHSAAGRLTRHFGAHYLGVEVLGSGERPDVDFDTGARITAPGYALVSLSGGLQLDPRFRIQVRCENLLDKKYQTADGYNQPGAGMYVTVSYGL
jgi:vitamin B12 transporter